MRLRNWRLAAGSVSVAQNTAKSSSTLGGFVEVCGWAAGASAVKLGVDRVAAGDVLGTSREVAQLVQVAEPRARCCSSAARRAAVSLLSGVLWVARRVEVSLRIAGWGRSPTGRTAGRADCSTCLAG